MPDATNDPYRILQVWPDAGPEAIEAAYRRLLDAADDDPQRRAELDEAYALLSDPERRAAYDREHAATGDSPGAVPPVPPFPQEPPPPQPPIAAAEDALTPPSAAVPAPPGDSAGPNRSLLAAMVGLIFLALAVSAGIVGWALTQDDDGSGYPTGGSDEEFDLEAMQLRNTDLPTGIRRAEGDEFDNAEWALLVAPDDPESTQNQLNAQGRVRNQVSYFTWDNPVQHLGEVLSVTSQSTLYTDEGNAQQSIRGLCGLLLDERHPLTEFAVPGLGDEATGFQVRQPNETFGATLETVICFRTGRVVHAVSQSGLQGTADIGLSVRLAERMLRRVDQAFDGNPAPLDDALPTEEGG
ncbi:MAG: J domain-containing protein [Dehalococcoidia bacterium]|nr:J domain-containing protein [Dehalococcoidia bacterium]